MAGPKKAMKKLKVCEQPNSNRPSNKSSASKRGRVGYPIDFAKYNVGPRTYILPDLKTSKLRVAGSNPAGVANNFKDLAQQFDGLCFHKNECGSKVEASKRGPFRGLCNECG